MDNQAKLEQQILSYEKIENQILVLKNNLKTTRHEINSFAEPPFQEGKIVKFVKYPDWLIFLDTLHTQKYQALAKEKNILYMYYNNPELEGVEVKIDHAWILSFNSGRNSLRWEIAATTSSKCFSGIFDQPINPFIKVKAELTKDNLVALIMRAYLEGEKGLDYYLTLNNNNYFEVVRVNLEQEPVRAEWGTLFKIVLDFPEDSQGNLHKQIYSENFTIYGGNNFADKSTVKELIKYYQMAP